MAKSVIRAPLRLAYNLVSSLSDRAVLAAARHGMVVPYQPIYGDSDPNAQRSCVDRWNAISSYLPEGPFFFLDIGSQLGYFTFQACERGAAALGIERERTYYDVANAVRHLRGIGQASFLQMEIDSTSVRSLPLADVVCCLSVFHHWVRESGFEEADRIFTALCDRADTIFFETGQPDEGNVDWSDAMSFMSPDVEHWISGYLQEKGFQRVITLGEFSTHLSDKPRFLFCARKR